MPSQGVVWFTSKVDWRLGMLLVLPPLGSLAVLVAGLTSSDRVGVAIGALACLFVVALYALVVLPVRYGVGSEELIIRFGVVRQRVRFASIIEVASTRSPLSSPALSLDWLAVRTGAGRFSMTMISPNDREAFLGLLAARAGLRRDGGRLVPREGG